MASQGIWILEESSGTTKAAFIQYRRLVDFLWFNEPETIWHHRRISPVTFFFVEAEDSLSPPKYISTCC